MTEHTSQDAPEPGSRRKFITTVDWSLVLEGTWDGDVVFTKKFPVRVEAGPATAS